LSNTTGSYNTAVGSAALQANTTGAANTAHGFGALASNTTASNNTAVGYQAGYANTTGTSIVAIGTQALLGATTSNNIVAIGDGALSSASSCFASTVVGSGAGRSVTTGGRNTLIGQGAGGAITTGEANTIVGPRTPGGTEPGGAITTGSKNSIFGGYSGNQGGLDIRTSDNYIVLSDGDGNPRGIFDGSGNFLVGATSNVWSAKLLVTSTAQITNFRTSSATSIGVEIDVNSNNTTQKAFLLYSDSSSTENLYIYSNGNVLNRNNSYGAISDIKLKENIIDATPKLADLMQVKVRNYNLIGDTTKQIGVIAQELETVFPSMIDESPDQDREGNDLGTTTKQVKYSVFVPMLIKAVQEQQAIIESLKARLDAANL